MNAYNTARKITKDINKRRKYERVLGADVVEEEKKRKEKERKEKKMHQLLFQFFTILMLCIALRVYVGTHHSGLPAFVVVVVVVVCR